MVEIINKGRQQLCLSLLDKGQLGGGFIHVDSVAKLLIKIQ